MRVATWFLASVSLVCAIFALGGLAGAVALLWLTYSAVIPLDTTLLLAGGLAGVGIVPAIVAVILSRGRPPGLAIVAGLVNIGLVAGTVAVSMIIDTPGAPAPIDTASTAVSGAPAGSGEAVAVGVPTFDPSDPDPATVLFIGDSLTDGFFATDETRGFAPLVAAGLGRPVELVESSKAHADTTTVAGITDVPAEVDLAVVELGTNDVERTAPGDFAAAYRGLLEKIRATSPDAALACVGVWFWPDPGAPFDQIIADECGRAGGSFVRVTDLFDDEALRGPVGESTPFGASDDFHPNDAGHAAIADRVLSAIVS